MRTPWSEPRSRLWPVLVALLCSTLPALARAAPPDTSPETGDDPLLDDPLLDDPLLDDARGHEAGARFEDAAAAYERFAAEQPDDFDAPDALANAYLLRVGLGQDREALADLDQFQRVYGRKRPERAAGLFWSRQSQLRSNQDRRDHAQEYLKLHGRSGGRDREIVAEAVIAQIDWRRSCDEPLLLDTCVSRARNRYAPGNYETRARRRWPRYCRDTVALHTTVHSRGRKLSRAAQARLARILELIGDGGEFGIPAHDPERWRAYADAKAMAMVYQADAKLEALLTREAPDELMLGVEDSRRDSGERESERIYARQAKSSARSVAKLNEFIASWTKAGDALEREYGRIAETGSATWTVVAANRVATLRDTLADRLAFSQVSDEVASREQYDSHCTRFANRMKPLRDRAQTAYLACLERSVELKVDDESSHACFERLAELDPDTYPQSEELIGEPNYHRGTAVSLGVVDLH